MLWMPTQIRKKEKAAVFYEQSMNQMVSLSEPSPRDDITPADKPTQIPEAVIPPNIKSTCDDISSPQLNKMKSGAKLALCNNGADLFINKSSIQR